MQQRETLSAYMDGHNVERTFTDALCKSDELQQKWANYHTIRSIMRGEEILLDHHFSAKMAALLEQEEMQKIDQNPPLKRGLLVKLKRWSTPLMQAGIAASVCFVAVFGVNLMNNNSDEIAQTQQPTLQTLPFSNSVQPVSYNAPTQIQPTAEQLEYQQQRINALLQNHELQRRTHLSQTGLNNSEALKNQNSTKQETVEPVGNK